MSGGELFQRVADADCLTEKEASFYMYQLLQGLQYMHMKNIVHLDLKVTKTLHTTDHKNSYPSPSSLHRIFLISWPANSMPIAMNLFSQGRVQNKRLFSRMKL